MIQPSIFILVSTDDRLTRLRFFEMMQPLRVGGPPADPPVCARGRHAGLSMSLTSRNDAVTLTENDTETFIDTLWPAIQSAAERLRGQAHQTPVATSRTLDGLTGARVVLKCENLQRMGAFKFRGAYNAMSRLTENQRRQGVITHSSGNHAQAVSLVGRMLDIPVTVVMPADAPAVKRQATEGYGGNVVDYDPDETTREAVSASLLKRRPMTLVPPFDHPDVIAGQGTCALELCQSHGPLDVLLAPCGGGGLLGGCAAAAKALIPGCRVVGVEPETADDATRSFATGRLHTVHNPPTIADGTRTASLGRYTFPLIRRAVDAMVTVSEAEIVAAVRFLFERMKLVVEPSGALGVAALLAGRLTVEGRVGVILSGGNVDAATMARILSDPAAFSVTASARKRSI
jgi:threonine dehydratase